MSEIDDFLSAKPKTGGGSEIDSFLGPGPSSGIRRTLADNLAIPLAKGIIGVPEGLVGLADIPTGGYAGKGAEALGIRFKDAKSALDEMLSPEQQAINRGLQETKGFGPTLGYALSNPSTIGSAVLESVPSMLGGAAVGRKALALAPKLTPYGAAAIGEGAVAAGQSAESIRQQTPEGLLTPGQSALAAGSGVVTGLIGRGGGAVAQSKLGQRLGLTDIDAAIVAGKLASGAAGTGAMAKRVGAGFVTEGGEELAQSAQEQAAQNLALGRPVGEGVSEAAAMGLLTGGVMGAGANVPRGPTRPAPQTGVAPAATAQPSADSGQPVPPVIPASAPTPQTGDGSQGLPRTSESGSSQLPPAPIVPLDRTAEKQAVIEAATQPNAGAIAVAAGVGELTGANDQAAAQQQEQLNASIAEAAGEHYEAQNKAVVKQEAALAEADARVEAQRQQQSEAQRRSMLNAILEDQDVRDPVGKMAAELKRAGYQGEFALPSKEEMATIKRHADVRAAIEAEHVAEGTPNEMDVSSLVREKKPAGGATAKAPATKLPDDLRAAAIAAKAMKDGGATAFFQAVKRVTKDEGQRRSLMAAFKAFQPDQKAKEAERVAVAQASAKPADSATPAKPSAPAIRENPATVAATSAQSQASQLPQSVPAEIVTPNAPLVRGGTEPKREDRFTDAKGKQYEVWKSRLGLIEAHPVIDGKPVVNRTTTERWAITPQAQAAYPDARTDFHPGPAPASANGPTVQASEQRERDETKPQQGNTNVPLQVKAEGPLQVKGAGPGVSRLNAEDAGVQPGVGAQSGSPRPDAGNVQSGGGANVAGSATAEPALKAAHETIVKAKAQTDARQRKIIDGVAAEASKIRAGKAPQTALYVRQLQGRADAIEQWDKKAADAVRVLANHVESARPRTAADEKIAAKNAKRRTEIANELTALQAKYEKKSAGSSRSGMVPPSIKTSALSSITKQMDRLDAELKALGPDTSKADNALPKKVRADQPPAAKPAVAKVGEQPKPQTEGPVVAKPSGFPVGGWHAIESATGRNLGQQGGSKGSKRFPTAEKAMEFGNKVLAQEAKASAPKLSDKSASELASMLAENREKAPRPLNKMFGNNPTPEQIAQHKALASANNSEGAKLRMAHKVALERDNAAFRAKQKIEDVGEKIGAARKDLAESTGERGVKRSSDDSRPAWARRFKVAQIVSAVNESKVGQWVIHDERNPDFMGKPRQIGSTFTTKDEAESAIPLLAVALKHRAVPVDNGRYEIWRDITDRKRVKVVNQQFASRDEALTYMARNAVAILETNTTFGEADLPLPPNRKRTGPERRTGNVVGEDFKDTFGLRGVEFGNWNNQDERQALMNDAYDALMDLADVMGIPPKAIGLNGDLALAFGARGHGLNSARAHYERDRAVINLTKERGAGSLAHEWFHAMDHYFGRQDGKASAEWVRNADGTRTLKAGSTADYVSHGFRGDRSGVRPELRAAYDAVINTMAKKATVYVEDTAKADSFTARARDDLASALDKLRAELSAQKDTTYYKRNNKPASAEQLAAFDAIAKQMVNGETDALKTDWRHIPGMKARVAARWTNDSLEAVNAIYKDVRGRTGFDSQNSNGWMDGIQSAMKRYSARLKMLADAQSGTEKTRFVPTEFAMNAKELDQGRGTDYWTTAHEMAARAFQGYIEDKIAERGDTSRFLNYAPEKLVIETPWGYKRPYPHGDERKAINAALDKFVETLETKATDKGIALANIARQGQPQGITPLDRHLYGLVQKGASIKQLLETIVLQSKNPLHKAIARLMLKANITPSIRIADVSEFAEDQLPKGVPADELAAMYAPDDNSITLFQGLGVEHDILHEAGHAMLFRAIKAGGETAKALQAMYDHVKAFGTFNENEYGLTNVHEFASEIMSNEAFRAELKAIPAARGLSFKSTFDWFVDIYRKVLGLPPMAHNALSQSLDLINQLSKESQEIRAATARGSGLGSSVDASRHSVRGPGGKFHPDVTPGQVASATFDSVKGLWEDLSKSDRVLNRVISKFNTPYHIAETHPQFKPVYNEAQDFNHDISRYAKSAADQAPDLLVTIEAVKDFGKKSPSNADVKATADAIYAGTFFGGASPLEGRVFTDAELKSGKIKEGGLQLFAPMSNGQVKLYRQSLAAVGDALTENAKSILHRLARFKKIDLDREGSLDQMVGQAKEAVDEEVGRLNTARKESAARIAESIEGATEADLTANKNYKTDLAKKEKTEAERHDAQIEELNAFKVAADDIFAKTQGLIEHGYFPAMRFGKYAVYAVRINKDGSKEQLDFSRFDTQLAANAYKRDLQKQFPDAVITSDVMNEDAHKLFSGLNLDALEMFAEHMVDDNGNPISKDPLMQEFFRVAASERSALKRQIHRKGVAGYSTDIPRALAQFTVSQATSTSRNYHAAPMLEKVQAIKSGDLQGYATRYVSYLQDPREESQGLRSFMANYFILGSIASGAVNMTQPVLMTAPYLSQYTGWTNAMAELGKAAKDLVTGRKTLTPEERAAYGKAAAAGTVSPQEIHQIRAETRASTVGDSKVWQKMESVASAYGIKLPGKLTFRKMSYLWGSIYSLTEQFNRGSTFLASYRIAKAKGMADPYTFAVNAVDATQGVYNKGNRPEIARGNVGSVAMTFKQFSIAYLEMGKRLYTSDKKAFAILMLTLLAASGAGGLPFADDLSDLIDALGQWMGFSTNTKKSVRKWAQDQLGNDIANVLQYGVSGIPGMPIDVAGRLGMHNIVPGTAALKTSEPDKTRDIIELLGPAASLFQNVGKAVQGTATGDFGKTKYLLPTALQNAVAGGDMLSSGIYRDQAGRKIMDVDTVDSMFKLVGFQPEKVAYESRIIQQNQQDKDLHKVMESSIAGRIAQSAVEQDPEMRMKAYADLQAWNATNPELRIQITPSQIQSRVRAMMETREQRSIRTTAPELRGQVAQDLRAQR